VVVRSGSKWFRGGSKCSLLVGGGFVVICGCNACNDDSSDRIQQDLGDLGDLEACCAAASYSFLELPAASYSPNSHHEALAMRATRKLVISTKWKEVWTIGNGSELLRCCFL